ncbi:hypothetical protein EZV62_002097 [Acer yangbiense]|uniref:J domain-containing protein n=1 Tax=Acer yangbiense TaxID=1000413 RepID=A0A5C7IWP6_9ROSI|nr:hypothetical protein EZV62_002097 [Acer yangbiense]
MGDSIADDDLLLKNFFAEVSEVERDNEVARILSCFKLNPFEYLNLPFDASLDDVKKQYRKLSLMVHPDKCKNPLAKEAFGEELRAKRKKQLRKDAASKIKSLVDEGKYEQQYERSEEFQQELKLKVSSWRDFMKTGKKGKKGEIRPPKLKTEDPNKSYVQRPVKRG